MLTQNGMLILQKIADIHREEYIRYNPGCNENDCERQFLHTMLLKFCSHHQVTAGKLANEIETIR